MMMNSQLIAHADEAVRPWLKSRRHLSLVIGLLHEGQEHVMAHGQPAGLPPVPPGERVYEIGSVTKLFTATLLAGVILQGKGHLEEPVPGLSGVSPEQPISLLQLVTHTSGLPRLPSNLNITRESRANPYANYLAADLEHFLAGFQPKRRRVGRYAYSNLGMGLLGNVLAAKLGMSYEEAVVTQLCLPLGMADTRVRLTPAQERRWVQGYSARGKQVPAWNIPTLAGAGAFRSTANDLLKFLAANLEQTESPLSQALRLCQEPRHRLSRHHAAGMGWIISERRGRRFLWHNGATGGFNSFVGLLPEQRFGVVVLANQGLSLWAGLGLTRDLATDIGVRVARLLLRQER